MQMRAILSILFFSWLLGTALGQGRELKVDDPSWELSGDVSRGEWLGRQSFRIGTGRAVKRDVSLLDGTIEFDLAVTDDRSFVYVQFRMESDREYESIYFRPHKSGAPDAVQYSPVYKGSSNWQLYHKEGFTAAVDLPDATWIHVRLVLNGPRAALFVGDSSKPQMVISRLARDPKAGYVAVRSFKPPLGRRSKAIYTGCYTNLVVRPGHIPYDFGPLGPEQSPQGTVGRWRVSQPFVPPQGAVTELPAETLKDRNWATLETDSSGLLVFGRYLPRLQGTRRPAALARLTLTAAQAGRKRLNLGFSDEVSVFLNGELLYYGKASYSFNFPRRQGLIGLEQAAVYLPLRQGENQLILAVADSFGGWGLMGRFEDPSGLRIDAE